MRARKKPTQAEALRLATEESRELWNAVRALVALVEAWQGVVVAARAAEVIDGFLAGADDTLRPKAIGALERALEAKTARQLLEGGPHVH